MDAYAGSPFQVNKAFAQLFSDRWVILSAKHGFIDPDFMIPGDYDATFKKPETKPISLDELEKQVQRRTARMHLCRRARRRRIRRHSNPPLHGPQQSANSNEGSCDGNGNATRKILLRMSRETMLKTLTTQNEPWWKRAFFQISAN